MSFKQSLLAELLHRPIKLYLICIIHARANILAQRQRMHPDQGVWRPS
jgi:hypothetical protein